MILSIDPGVTACGVAVTVLEGDELKVLDTVNVSGTLRLVGDFFIAGEKYGKRTGKVHRIISVVNGLLDKYPTIDMIALEAPFYNRRAPQAFASLLEVVYGIKYMVAIERGVDLRVMSPMAVKKVWTGKGNSGKDIMYNSLVERLNNKQVVLPDNSTEDTLTEHEIDSIAVGYTYQILKLESSDEISKKDI